VPGLLDAAEPDPVDFSQSGLVTGQPKALKHKEIPGFLNAAQIAPHHTTHYGGALNQESLGSTSKGDSGHAPSGEVSEKAGAFFQQRAGTMPCQRIRSLEQLFEHCRTSVEPPQVGERGQSDYRIQGRRI
jgi:hypothetical protein